MSYIDSAALVASGVFGARVQLAVMKAAVDILNEVPDPDWPAKFTKRAALAQSMLQDAPPGVFIKLCAVNPTIAAAGESASDGDIEFVVAGVWDAVAGVLYDDVH